MQVAGRGTVGVSLPQDPDEAGGLCIVQCILQRSKLG